MTENAIILFTGRPPDQILAEGGTQAWVLNARRARKCKYAVCVQNFHTYEEFSPTEPHKTAFMVGKVSAVDLSDDQPDPVEEKPERYIIRFDQYARIAIPDAWDGSRNPVKYTDIMSLGINPANINFQPMPEVKKAVRPEEGLTIAQAKIGLSITFGVKPEAIEITIRT